MLEEETLPQPLYNQVLIANPLTVDNSLAIDEEAQKLPEDKRDEFLRNKMSEMWGVVTILAVGPECRGLSVDDRALGNSDVARTALVTPDRKYLIISETVFKAKWS